MEKENNNNKKEQNEEKIEPKIPQWPQSRQQ